MTDGGARGPNSDGPEGGEPSDADVDPDPKVRFEPIAVSAEDAAAILAELGVVDDDGPSITDDGSSADGQQRRRWFRRRNRSSRR